jgi:hypothetical protein
MTAKGDKEKFFKTLAIVKCKGIRAFGNWVWGDGEKLQPYIQKGTWTHPTTKEVFAFYGDTLNPEYFAVLRENMKLCKMYGQILVFSFLDYRDPDKHSKYKTCFRCSKQAFDHPGGFYGSGVVPYFLKYMRRVIYWADKLKVDMRYEIANEFNTCGWETDEHDPNRPLKWYKEILTALKQAVPNYEKGYTLPAIGPMIHSGAYREEVRALGIRYCYHRIGRATQASTLTERISWASGDGFFAGTGDPDQVGRRGVGIKEAEELGPALKANAFINTYEWMCRRLWFKDNDRANLDDFRPLPLQKLISLQ